MRYVIGGSTKWEGKMVRDTDLEHLYAHKGIEGRWAGRLEEGPP
jgi:hypothetical protein